MNYATTFLKINQTPGGADTFFYVAEFGPVTADDVCNLNDEQARRHGAEPTLDYSSVVDALKVLDRLAVIVTDGSTAWRPTGYGIGLHRWLAQG